MSSPFGEEQSVSLEDIPVRTESLAQGPTAGLEKSRLFVQDPRLHATHRAEEEFERLIGEVKALRERSASLADRLFVVLPEAAKYRQAFDDIRGSSGWSTLVVAVGSCVISYAGTLDPGSAKTGAQWGGIALAVTGGVWAIWSLIGIRVTKG